MPRNYMPGKDGIPPPIITGLRQPQILTPLQQLRYAQDGVLPLSISLTGPRGTIITNRPVRRAGAGGPIRFRRVRRRLIR